MKRIISTLFCNLFVLAYMQAQKLPEFIQQNLDTAKIKAKIALEETRFYENGYRERQGELPYANRLSSIFSDDEKELIDNTGIKLHLEMIFDNEMRDRIVQLMQNKYCENELDSLVNIIMKYNTQMAEMEAMEICRVDTLVLLTNSLDSLYSELKSRNEVNLMKKDNKIYDYEIFKYLKLDTVFYYKQTYNRITEREKEKERKYWLNKTYYNYTYLAELCGYIGDKRFVKPLIEALDKPDNFNREKVIEALSRMRVEPYYSNYVKERTLTPEQINDEENWLSFKIEDFVYILGTQKDFLELSKYLLSNKPYTITMIDFTDHSEHSTTPVSSSAFYLIRDNIMNEDLQKMVVGDVRKNIKDLKLQMYDWMQKNYGKYKIRRIW